MTSPLVTVLTVNFNQPELIALQLHALSVLTESGYRVIVVDNGSRLDDCRRLAEVVKGESRCSVHFRTPTLAGSAAHAEALDEAMDWVSTPYTVMVDSDCAFLRRSWDTHLMKVLRGPVKAVGASPPGRGDARRVGAGEFPLSVAVLIETAAYRRARASCAVGDLAQGQDTCWSWKRSFDAAGFSGSLLEARNTRDHGAGPFGRLTGVEEYFTEDGLLLASHFGRGSSLGAAKYMKGLSIPLFAGYLKRLRGGREMRQWIGICREIIQLQQ